MRSLIFILLAILLAASAALAEGSRLSPRLAALAAPDFAASSAAVQRSRLSLANGLDDLLHDASGAPLVYIHVRDTDADTLAALAHAGARVVHVAPRYKVVTAHVDPNRLAAMASLPQVTYLDDAPRPVTGRAEIDLPAPAAATSAVSAPLAVTCPWGSVRSEAWTQLAVDQANAAYGVTGAGITVGVLSDSYNRDFFAATNAAGDVSTGDLPGPGNPCGHTTPVNVLSEYQGSGGTDEGRGMVQLVHDVAPAAHLAFASAFNGLYDFADQIRALRFNAGADVIVDDVTYFVEPFFQDGPVSLAVQDVVADGAVFFSSAGNSNVSLNGRSVASWEAPAYRPTTCPAGLTPQRSLTDCQNFLTTGGADPDYGMTLKPGRSFTLILQWAESWNDIRTDFDLYVLDDFGNILATSSNDNMGSQVPYEQVGGTNFSASNVHVRIVVGRHSGTATPRIKYVLMGVGSGFVDVEYDGAISSDTYGPAIFGHNGAEKAASVAAVPYNDAQSPEAFTSLGPVTHYFAPADGQTPGGALATPLALAKPDFAATDGGATTFFGQQDGFGVWRFYGTSAAAPHAAGVAALMLERAASRQVTLAPARINQILAATASTVANGGGVSTGSGLVNALAAVGAAGQGGNNGASAQMLLLLGD